MGGAGGGAPGGAPPTNPNDAWQEFTAPTGKKYFYNMLTQENTWEKPQALKDKEAAGGGKETASGGGGVTTPTQAAINMGYAGFRPLGVGGDPTGGFTASDGVPNKDDKVITVSLSQCVTEQNLMQLIPKHSIVYGETVLL